MQDIKTLKDWNIEYRKETGEVIMESPFDFIDKKKYDRMHFGIVLMHSIIHHSIKAGE